MISGQAQMGRTLARLGGMLDQFVQPRVTATVTRRLDCQVNLPGLVGRSEAPLLRKSQLVALLVEGNRLNSRAPSAASDYPGPRRSRGLGSTKGRRVEPLRSDSTEFKPWPSVAGMSAVRPRSFQEVVHIP